MVRSVESHSHHAINLRILQLKKRVVLQTGQQFKPSRPDRKTYRQTTSHPRQNDRPKRRNREPPPSFTPPRTLPQCERCQQDHRPREGKWVEPLPSDPSPRSPRPARPNLLAWPESPAMCRATSARNQHSQPRSPPPKHPTYGAKGDHRSPTQCRHPYQHPPGAFAKHSRRASSKMATDNKNPAPAKPAITNRSLINCLVSRCTGPNAATAGAAPKWIKYRPLHQKASCKPRPARSAGS